MLIAGRCFRCLTWQLTCSLLALYEFVDLLPFDVVVELIVLCVGVGVTSFSASVLELSVAADPDAREQVRGPCRLVGAH